MDTVHWFDRNFNFSFGTEKYAGIRQRLKQAPDILNDLLRNIPEQILVQKPAGKWSVKEHTGHLSVLEPLWRIRWQDILDKKPVLTTADLNNTATSRAGFNDNDILSLLERFAQERNTTLSFLDSIDPQNESQTSLHPRLQQPMRIIDLALFVAEHDDHHISVIRAMIR
jgi:uncharacterized damage-inducible protein DinB